MQPYTRGPLQVESVQPMVTIEDCVEAEDIFKSDPQVQRLIRERYGITDMAEVACDPWYYGGRFGEHHPQLLVMRNDTHKRFQHK